MCIYACIYAHITLSYTLIDHIYYLHKIYVLFGYLQKVICKRHKPTDVFFKWLNCFRSVWVSPFYFVHRSLLKSTVQLDLLRMTDFKPFCSVFAKIGSRVIDDCSYSRIAVIHYFELRVRECGGHLLNAKQS